MKEGSPTSKMGLVVETRNRIRQTQKWTAREDLEYVAFNIGPLSSAGVRRFEHEMHQIRLSETADAFQSVAS